MSPSLDAASSVPYFHSRACSLSSDESLLRSAFRLRYQIYCLECEFLAAADYPSLIEIDEYDSDAAHFCTYNREEELVGYVRLIIPASHSALPVLQRCGTLLPGIELPPLGHAAEISRLMVREDYRRRRGDTLSGVGVDDVAVVPDSERRTKSPRILLSMFRQMYLFSLQRDIRYWFAAMESPLARVLSRMHFSFRQIGPMADYYGPVAPYMADLRELEAAVGTKNPALLDWLKSAEKLDL
jgi:N-acyl amino acid synthase of PEP-CTERM/exosortase system